MKDALHNGVLITADQGLVIRTANGGLNANVTFVCPECSLPVKVHRAGGRNPEHFEHYARNAVCSRVHRPDLAR